MLEVRDLRIRFTTDTGVVHALNGVDYSVAKGESLAIVGESGSGKSASVLSILGLLPRRVARITGGQILFDGRDLLALSSSQLRRIRGSRIAMVFQDPMTSLNPLLTVGQQLVEGTQLHLGLNRRAARERATQSLETVGIADAPHRIDDYPHEFSGGQRQRIGIAIALACEPDILIADEPTTALDVTVQAQILNLVQELQDRTKMSVIWISHDLGVVAGLVDRVAVMYAGRIVEIGPVEQVFRHPRHPYTVGLLRSLPDPDAKAQARLVPIDGLPPDLSVVTPGCAFAPRCAHAEEACRSEVPALDEAGTAHRVACRRWRAIAAQAAGSGAA